MFGIAQFEIAKSGEQGAVARIAGGHHAVKHINALRDAFDQIFGRTDTHQ